jgi:hypothetical protein
MFTVRAVSGRSRATASTSAHLAVDSTDHKHSKRRQKGHQHMGRLSWFGGFAIDGLDDQSEHQLKDFCVESSLTWLIIRYIRGGVAPLLRLILPLIHVRSLRDKEERGFLKS